MFGVSCGDTINAQVDQTNGVTADMFVWDTNNNNYFDESTNQISNGSTAECIVERPYIIGYSPYPPLSDFNNVAFSNCGATRNGSDVYVEQLPNNQIP